MIRCFVLAILVTQLPVTRSCIIHLPSVKLSPSSISFSPQLVDPGQAASAPQKIMLTNSGNASLTITKIESSGGFSQTSDCPINSGIAAGATCTIHVTFSPNVVGDILGAVTITDNGTGNPHVLPLSGTGLAPVGLSPVSLDFGTVGVNNTSAPQMVTVTNNQIVALNIGNISASGDYTAVPNNCSSLQPGKSCTIAVSFHPSTAGIVPGALTLTTDSSLGTQPVGLTGLGSGTVTSSVELSPASVDFGNHEAGTISNAKTVTLRNTGSISLSIQDIIFSGGYQKSADTCGTLLSAGSSCTITVKFAPSANFANIDYPGAITIIDSDPTSTQVVGLSGTGVQPITSFPVAVDFGTIDPNTTATDQSVRITNNHSAAQDVTIATSGHFDLSSNGCTQSLVPGAHCDAKVGFTSPYQAGANTGAITVSGSSSSFLTPTVVGISACVTQVAVSPRNFNFGALAVGAASDPETTTISNNGGDLKISGATITGANSGDFEISNNTCSGTLASGTSCTLDITYKPAASGTRTAALSINDDGACSPQQEVLNGGSSAGPFVLYTTVNGTGNFNPGSGTVSSKPAGINDCGIGVGVCTARFATGTSVTLTAAPDANSQFSGWSGVCTGTGSCVLDMESDKQVTAGFAGNPTLIVQFGGNGSGKVTSNPLGIDCPSNQCAVQFARGTVIMLSASADTISTFTGWSGGGCSGTGKCSLTLTTDETVTANFIAPDFGVSAFSLAPSAIPAGKGAVSTMAITSMDGFTGAVALSCTVDPSPNLAPACSISPSPVTLTANGSVNATLNISTSAPTMAAVSVSGMFPALLLPLAGIAWLVFDLSSRERRILVRERVLCVLLLAGIAFAISCGGGSATTTTQQRVGGTPPGSYTITVTGTSGSVQHSATTTLTVQ